MRFIVFLVRFVEKKTKNSKFWDAAKDPTQHRGREGGFFHPWVRRSEVELCCSEATVHSMEMLCFCFVLFFCCFEDLFIGLIRIL